ncbi:MAG: hypothetical protein KFF73_16620 [Cyclobacteriaceae bacterium]|nr:hypothetical protein [Cyclobacteriaceae bacterium]
MPGKVIEPNHNVRERNYGVVYVYNEMSVEEGLYIYDKMKRDGTRGLLAGDIIGICGPVEEVDPEELDKSELLQFCQISGKIKFNGILTNEGNAPVIRVFRQRIGDVDEIENIITGLIEEGKLPTDFEDMSEVSS